MSLWMEYLWYFLIYAFIGWCVEVAYAAVKTKSFLNRGFLFGPVCPIYGVGMIIVLFTLNPLRHNLLLLFAGSFLLTSGLELLTGFILEKLFHTKWWDYSMRPFNIGGYVCLRFSLYWGVGGIFAVDLLHPPIAVFVRHLPMAVSYLLLMILVPAFAADLVLTVFNILHIQKHIRVVEGIERRLHSISEELGSDISDGVLLSMEKNEALQKKISEKKEQFEAIKKQLQEFYQSKKFFGGRLFHVFPALNKMWNERRRFQEKIMEELERYLS